MPLFAKAEYRGFVTSVSILRATDSPGGTGIPKDLFGFMARGILQDGFGIGDILPGISLSNTLKGEYKMILIPKVVERFAGWFPNIRTIWMTYDNINSGVSQFAALMVGAYEKQLKHLTVDRSLLNIQKFPAQLTTLSCPGEEKILSKVNPLPLQTLTVNYGRGFSWSFFQTSKDLGQNVVVFPNLKDLSILRAGDGTRDTLSLTSKRSNSLRLHFPKLQSLRLEASNEQKLDFEVYVIPKHLSSIFLLGNAYSVVQLSKLPIKAVDRLNVLVVDEGPPFTNEFYRALCRLFSKLKIVSHARLVLDCDISLFDLQQVCLTSVVCLNIQPSSPEMCRNWLLSCPRLKTFCAFFPPDISDVIEWRDITESVFPELAELKLESLSIQVEQADMSMQRAVSDCSLCLLKSLKNLKRVQISECYAQDIWLKVQKTKYKFPHLGKIDYGLNPF